MSTFRTARALSTAAVLAALLGMTGCGSDSSDEGDKDTSPGTTTTTAPGESEGDEVLDICKVVTDDEMAALAGGPVTRVDVPGGGCTFNQEDPRATSLSLSATAFDEGTGGFDGAVSGIKGALQGSVGEEVPGVGTEAYVVTGTTPGGSNQQASGVVHVGGSVVQVVLLQGTEQTADAVKAITIDTLELAASKG